MADASETLEQVWTDQTELLHVLADIVRRDCLIETGIENAEQWPANEHVYDLLEQSAERLAALEHAIASARANALEEAAVLADRMYEFAVGANYTNSWKDCAKELARAIREEAKRSLKTDAPDGR